ncbi:hypothetical protein K1719_041255 [Acacia pycnantha]|nr:hypothetical protein K1719_041255 [Acacia pycnantha]
MEKCFKDVVATGYVIFMLHEHILSPEEAIDDEPINNSDHALEDEGVGEGDTEEHPLDHNKRPSKKRKSILSRRGWVEELKRGNENRFFKQFRMRKHVFGNLVSKLTQHFGLKPTQHVGVMEAMDMFLYMIGHRATYRDVEERDLNILERQCGGNFIMY